MELYRIYSFVITTIIFLSIAYLVMDITNNQISNYIIYSFVAAIYSMFVICIFGGLTFKTVLLILWTFTTLILLITFLIIYYGSTTCTPSPNNNMTNDILINAAAIILIPVAIYIGLYNRNNYMEYKLLDTIRFITSLVILRCVYYISENTNYTIIDNIAGTAIIVICFFNIRRFYYLFTTQKQIT